MLPSAPMESGRQGNAFMSPVVLPQSFNPPEPSKYKTCCCHVSTCATLWGVIELIGLIIGACAIIYYLCQIDITLQQVGALIESDIYRGSLYSNSLYLTATILENNKSMLIVAICILVVRFVPVCMLLHGIRYIRWGFLVPYFAVHCLTVVGIIVWALILLIKTKSASSNDLIQILIQLNISLVALIVGIFISLIVWRCIQFLKQVLRIQPGLIPPPSAFTYYPQTVSVAPPPYTP